MRKITKKLNPILFSVWVCCLMLWILPDRVMGQCTACVGDVNIRVTSIQWFNESNDGGDILGADEEWTTLVNGNCFTRDNNNPGTNAFNTVVYTGPVGFALPVDSWEDDAGGRCDFGTGFKLGNGGYT